MNMNGKKIVVRVNELKRLMEWLDEQKLLDQNSPVTFIQGAETGLGASMEAYVEVTDGSGVWKDLTDYSEW